MNHNSPKEELWSSLTHGFGFVLSIVGLLFLVLKGIQKESFTHVIAGLVFGLSLGLCYFSSTAYHAVKKEKLKVYLRCLDHAAIYILIAGTYTPYLLFNVGQEARGLWLPIIWGFAAVGVVIKMFFTGKYELLSTFAYLVMGWIGLIFIRDLVSSIPSGGLYLLIAGGLVYSLGAVVFLLDRLPYNHVIWHVFVLGGSICHYFSIFLYVA